MTKQHIHKILSVTALILALSAVTSCGKSKSQPTSATYREIGCPAADCYPDNNAARCVWDLIVFDGKLYAGSGDFDKNAGPVPVLYCNLDDIGNWQVEATLPDEELARFLILNGQLTVPGIDPTGEPEEGTYYQLVYSEWLTLTGLPDGYHNFDLIEYDGYLFAGIGAARGESPVVRSRDGFTFERIPMLKNGEPFQTWDGEIIRTHDFFIQNDTLYATLWYEDQTKNKLTYDLYRYENGVFVFDFDLLTMVNAVEYAHIPIGGKASMAGKTFFTTGYLYVTENMHDWTRMRFPQDEIVYDLYMEDGVLYVLTAVKQEDDYRIVIYKNSTGETTDFEEVLWLTYALPPISLACTQEHFYIGVGDCKIAHEKNGMILEVKRK